MAETFDRSLWRPATDLTKRRFENEVVQLAPLFRAHTPAGQTHLRGLVFVNCRVEGPAVVLVGSGVLFDACDLGDAQGDARSLLLRPVHPGMVTGAIPMEDCHFERCAFVAVGYTGPEDFLTEISGIAGPSTARA